MASADTRPSTSIRKSLNLVLRRKPRFVAADASTGQQLNSEPPQRPTRPKSRTKHFARIGATVPFVLAIGTAVPATASPPAQGSGLLPGVYCDAQYKNGRPVGSSRCKVASGQWTYYQAFLTHYDNCGRNPFTTQSTVRVQILARKGGTGVHIGGVWVVFHDGNRRFGVMKFDMKDGNGTTHNDNRNNRGWFSQDVADLYSNGSDPSRYGYTTSNFLGLAWGKNKTALMDNGYFNMANFPQPWLSGASTCNAFPLSVVFTQ